METNFPEKYSNLKELIRQVRNLGDSVVYAGHLVQ
jgi:hypothetical protein